MSNRRSGTIIAIVLTVSAVGFGYSGGAGTESSPYQLNTPADWLQLMSTPADWDKHFILTASLDLNGMALTPVGSGSTAHSAFVGSLNGNGYVIRRVSMDIPSEDNVGLFGVLSGRVWNLVLEDVTITGRHWVGGLAGRLSNAVVEDIFVTGTIVSTGNYAGGLCGSAVNVALNRCASFGTVNGNNYTGGLVGYIQNNYLKACYSQSAVQGGINVGGLVGVADSPFSMRHCYSAGSVSGTSAVGGLLGFQNGSGSWEGCFWDVQASGQTASAAGTGLTTAQMKRPWVYAAADWRLEEWGIAPEQTYPFLRRVPASDLNYSGRVDLEDLELFAQQWLLSVPFPEDL